MEKSRRQKYLVSIVGPTAVGKTAMAIEIARAFSTEIISADSRQFFREMEIGTAKPDSTELSLVKHHFVNSLSIEDDYNAGKFERDALDVLDHLFVNKNLVVMAGGSGLYCRAIWKGLDDMPEVREGVREQLNEQYANDGLDSLLEELHEKDPAYYEQVDRANHQRVIRALEVIRSTNRPFSEFRQQSSAAARPFINIKIGLNTDREILYDRIDRRMDSMIQQGLFEEARRLEVYRQSYALQTVGYQEIFPYFDGEYDYDEAVRLLKRNSRRYAKRQLTWFKKDQDIEWFTPGNPDLIISYIQSFLDA
jgi:tRNA dimethylallyltransferase